ncbi:DUF4105 domain-containing protein [Leptobacterium sp. I13]|uniref:lipoprotein N-acyltransferase Lnb domain-containing protein n=1 Tax=Leptobacterium meishanense TaxID=3128904 RepID=UPI0030EBB443
MKYFIALFLISLSAYSQSQNKDEYEFSILTCEPGSDLYSLFGHSALRLKNHDNDIVVNYGIFSFEEKNFIKNFLYGNLEYEVGLTNTKKFFEFYYLEDRSVSEDKINLSKDNKLKIINEINADLTKKKYSYNYFDNNCTTKLVKLFELDSIMFKNKNISETYREGLNKNLNHHKWLRITLNILLGKPSDRKLSFRERIFLPLDFNKLLNNSKIRDHKISFKIKEKKNYLFSPAAVIILLIILRLMFGNVIKLKNNIFDIPFFILISSIGISLIFLWFFTNHSYSKGNLNILWANPLYFLIFLNYNLLKSFFLKFLIILNCLFIIISFFYGQRITYEIYFLVIFILIILLIRFFRYKVHFLKDY